MDPTTVAAMTSTTTAQLRKMRRELLLGDWRMEGTAKKAVRTRRIPRARPAA